MKLFFSRKTKNSPHHPVAFGNNVIKKYIHHKHLFGHCLRFKTRL